jgi:hypothetical protein
MPTTTTTKRKTQATRRSTNAKKAAGTRARRAAATEAGRTRAQVRRSSTGAGRQADRAAAQGELGLATVANAVQGTIAFGFRLTAAVLRGVRRAF